MTDTNDPMERAYEVLGVALGAGAPRGLVPRAVRAAEMIAELRLAKFAAAEPSAVESADTLIDRWIVDRVIDTESQGRDVLRLHLEARDTAVRAKALQWTADDKALPEDEQIKVAHPLRSGSHALYAEAMRLVGAKRSKGALVELVNWLLTREDKALAHIAALEGGIVAEDRRVQKEMSELRKQIECLKAEWNEYPEYPEVGG